MKLYEIKEEVLESIFSMKNGFKRASSDLSDWFWNLDSEEIGECFFLSLALFAIYYIYRRIKSAAKPKQENKQDEYL